MFLREVFCYKHKQQNSFKGPEPHLPSGHRELI